MKLVLLLPALFFGFTLTSNSVAGTYTVKKGDSLRKIAQKEHCTVAQLEALNEPDYPLIIGQVLRTPDKGSIVQGAAETAAVNAKHPKQAQAAEDKQAETAEQLRQEWAQQDALDTQRRQKETDARQAASDGGQAQPSAAATSPRADYLARGQAAEQAGDLVAAYHWYMQGFGFDYRNEGNFLPSQVFGENETAYNALKEPEVSYVFKSLVSLAHVAQKRVNANVNDFCDNNNDHWRHYVVAEQAYDAALFIVLNRVHYDSDSDTYSGTYNSYGYTQLKAESEQSMAFFHDASQERREQHLAQLQDQENTMNAIAQGFQSAATAIERAPAFRPSVPPAEANAGPQITGGAASSNQVANQCNSDGDYLNWSNQCHNNLHGANQGPCYCAAAALLKCYIRAAPNNPNVGNWQKSYESAISNAQSVGQSCN